MGPVFGLREDPSLAEPTHFVVGCPPALCSRIRPGLEVWTVDYTELQDYSLAELHPVHMQHSAAQHSHSRNCFPGRPRLGIADKREKSGAAANCVQASGCSAAIAIVLLRRMRSKGTRGFRTEVEALGTHSLEKKR